MGQYWKPVNLDKREYVNPHKLAAGLKLWEQLANHPGVGAALIVLQACMPEARGGGDLRSDPIIGRWAGDRVVLVGDSSEDSDLPNSPIPLSQVYDLCYAEDDDGNPRTGAFKDITDDVVRVIEHELEGKFVGTGWKEWVTKDRIPEAVGNQLTTGSPRTATEGA